jgi:hypothetical protein
MATNFSKPVTGGLLSLIQDRAGAFAHQGRDLPLHIFHDYAFDTGGLNVNQQSVIASVNMWESPDILDFASRKFAYNATPENTSGCFCIIRHVDPTIEMPEGTLSLHYKEFFVLLVKAESSGTIRSYFIDAHHISSINQSFPVDKVKTPDAFFPRFDDLIHNPDGELLVHRENKWGFAAAHHESFVLPLQTPSITPQYHQAVLIDAFHKEDASKQLLMGLKSCIPHGTVTLLGGTDVPGPIGYQAYGLVQLDKKGDDGGSGGGGYGTSGSIVSPVCKDYTTRDGCLACCDNKELAVMAIASGLASAAAAAGVFGWITAGIIMAAAAAISLIEAANCRQRCSTYVPPMGNVMYP